MVQILHAPVPQMVDNVLDALRISIRPMAVQVIEVPKILIDVIPARSLVPEPQTAEQVGGIADCAVSHAHRLCRSPSRSSTLQFRRVMVASGVFQVFSQNRVQQRRLLFRTHF